MDESLLIDAIENKDLLMNIEFKNKLFQSIVDLSRSNLLKFELWSKLRYLWKDIQDYLNNNPLGINSRGILIGRICPVCGIIRSIKFFNHLLHHNITKLDYILNLNNYNSINEIPKCSNPNCNNKCNINYSSYSISKYCSLNCFNNHRVSLGIHPFSINNLKRDPITNKSIKHHDMAIKLVKEGKSNVSYNGDFDHDFKLLERIYKNKCNGVFGGYQGKLIKIKLLDKIYYLRSYWEFLTLLYLIKIEYINYNNIEINRCVNGFYPDFYIKSQDIFIDPHMRNDIENKKFRYKMRGIENIDFYDESDISYIRSLLLNIGYNESIYKDLNEINLFDFNTMKLYNLNKEVINEINFSK